MLQQEAGPFNIFGRLRGIFITETDQGTETRLLGDLLVCMMCLTVWVAMPFAWYLAHNFMEFIAFTTALSGVAIFINAAFLKVK
jgi:hypothetical protein